MRGEVIGINSFTFVRGQNVNGAIPINYVAPYLRDPPKMTYEEYVRQRTAGTPGASSRLPAGVPTPLPVSTTVVLTPHRGATIGSFEIKFGISPRDVTGALGTPLINGLTVAGNGFLRYGDTSPTTTGQSPGVSFFFAEGKLVQVAVLKINAKTSSGVGIGDGRDKIVQVYGSPRGGSLPGVVGSYTYADLGLTLYCTNNGTVEAIVIRAP